MTPIVISHRGYSKGRLGAKLALSMCFSTFPLFSFTLNAGDLVAVYLGWLGLMYIIGF
jgi:hypothetical protein